MGVHEHLQLKPSLRIGTPHEGQISIFGETFASFLKLVLETLPFLYLGKNLLGLYSLSVGEDSLPLLAS
jgi:hypothetical protein